MGLLSHINEKYNKKSQGLLKRAMELRNKTEVKSDEVLCYNVPNAEVQTDINSDVFNTENFDSVDSKNLDSTDISTDEVLDSDNAIEKCTEKSVETTEVTEEKPACETRKAEKAVNFSKEDLTKAYVLFDKMCNQKNIEMAAILFSANGFYKPVISKNVSKDTFIYENSTKSFWDERISNYAWNIFDEDFEQFFDIFADEQKENICNISVKKFSVPNGESFIFFAINCDFTKYETIDLEDEIYKIKKTLDKMSKIFPAIENQAEENYQKIISQRMQENPAIIFEINFASISSENYTFDENNKENLGYFIKFCIENLFPNPNIVKMDVDAIKVVYFCKYNVETDVLEFHVKNELENLLGNEFFSSVKLSNFTFTETLDEVLYHILG